MTRLEQMMIERGIDRATLADRLGRQRSVVDRWFRGERTPDIESVGAILGALGATWGEWAGEAAGVPLAGTITPRGIAAAVEAEGMVIREKLPVGALQSSVDADRTYTLRVVESAGDLSEGDVLYVRPSATRDWLRPGRMIVQRDGEALILRRVVRMDQDVVLMRDVVSGRQSARTWEELGRFDAVYSILQE